MIEYPIRYYYLNVTQLFKRSQTKEIMAAHFAKRNTKFGGGGKRGRAKIPSPQPPSFLPARAFGLAREARRQFRSKKVRISSNKRTNLYIITTYINNKAKQWTTI